MAQQQQQQFTQFVAVTVFTAIACAVGGFYFGVRWYVDHPQMDPRLQTSSTSDRKSKSKSKSTSDGGVVDLTDKPKSNIEDGSSSSEELVEVEVEDEDEDDDNPSGDYKIFTSNIMEECKLVSCFNLSLLSSSGHILDNYSIKIYQNFTNTTQSNILGPPRPHRSWHDKRQNRRSMWSRNTRLL